MNANPDLGTRQFYFMGTTVMVWPDKLMQTDTNMVDLAVTRDDENPP